MFLVLLSLSFLLYIFLFTLLTKCYSQSGKGFITLQDLFSAKPELITRLKYKPGDVMMYVQHCNLFNNYDSSSATPTTSPTKTTVQATGMGFDNFKKAFFPHLYVVA